jgi:protein-L-isoaspartate(D-aspartate) O-methyltransferase
MEKRTSWENFVENLISQGWLKSERIISAFLKIKRKDFLPENLEDLAEYDGALPIGFGQTISQPLVVAFMLELLQPKEEEKILDVGSGSGWTSALLAEIVGEKGKVIAIERIPELVEFGRKNVEKYNFVKKGRVKFVLGDGSKGYEIEAPFDKILASATAKSLPLAWQKQLKIGGRIVAPIENSIWLFIKRKENVFEEKEFPGFVFVPLIED